MKGGNAKRATLFGLSCHVRDSRATLIGGS